MPNAVFQMGLFQMGLFQMGLFQMGLFYRNNQLQNGLFRLTPVPSESQMSASGLKGQDDEK